MLRGIVVLAMMAMSHAAVAFSLFGPNVDQVKELLDDPYSAKFENVERLPNGAVCGQVNTKNQYGAYAGRKEFAIVDGKAYMEGSPDGEKQIILHCIVGKDCRDSACIRDSQDRIDKDERNKAVAATIGAQRGDAAKICRSFLESDAGIMVECSNAVVDCRSRTELSDEADCLQAVMNKHRR